MEYGKKIKKARTDKGLTQKQLADMIGVSNNLVCKWEIGDRSPKPNILKKLVNILDVDMRYFELEKEELIPLRVFKEIENGEIIYDYDIWNEKPIYKNIIVNLVNNKVFNDDVTLLTQQEINEKYFIYQSLDDRFHVIKKDFKKIVDGKNYALIMNEQLVLGQLFNYKETDFFAIIIDYNKILKKAVSDVMKGENTIQQESDFITREFFTEEDKNKIAGIVISTVINLE